MKHQQQNRRNKLQQFLQEKKLDAIFVTYPSNIFYISGFQSLTYNEREAFLLITRQNGYILTSKLYSDEVKNIPDFILEEISPVSPIAKAVGKIVRQEKIRSVGFEEHNLTYHEYQNLSQEVSQLIPITIDQIRIHKDPEEIANIVKACETGDKTFDFILKKIKPGITEKELAFEMEIFMRKQKTTPSFPSIVAFGKNASVPHHNTGKDTLKNNQFVLLDFGVKVNNYCSDMTRTVFIGNPTNEQKRMYETVRIAQEKAIEYIYKGDVVASDVDKIARDYITSEGYPNFPHSLGHGIGIDVHEGIRISPMSHLILEHGMVFSIEPGIYITDDVGVRVEDLVTIENNAVKLLTNAPKELIII